MEIYKITNLINNKVYIGQSARGTQQRFKRHIQDAVSERLDTHLARAIRMYGPENFTVEVIDTADTQDELNQKEQYWIRHYDSIKHGYNETDATYKCGGNTYMSKTELELFSIGDRIRESKLGSKNPRSRKVKCLNEGTGEELFFDTVKECQEYFGETSHQFISGRLNNRINSLYLTEWNFAYQDEPYRKMIERSNMLGTYYMVTNLETNKRVVYPSVEKMSKELGITRRILDLRIRKYGGHFTIDNYKIDILD